MFDSKLKIGKWTNGQHSLKLNSTFVFNIFEIETNSKNTETPIN